MLQLKRKNKGDNRDKERKEGKREREGVCVSGVFACNRGSCKREKGVEAGRLCWGVQINEGRGSEGFNA